MDILKALFGKAKNLLIGFAAVFVFWLILFLIMSLIPLPSVVLPASIVATLIITIFYLKKAFLIVEPKKAIATTFLGKDSRILLNGFHFLFKPFEKIYKKLDEDRIDLMEKISEKPFDGLICKDNVSLRVRVKVRIWIDYGRNKEDLIANIRKFIYTTDNPDSTIIKSIEVGLRDLAIKYETWLDLKAENTMKLSEIVVNEYIDETYGQKIICEIQNIEPENPTILLSYGEKEVAKNKKEVVETNAQARAIEEKLQIEAIGDQIEYLMKKFKRSYEEALEVVRYQDNQGLVRDFAINGNTLITQNPIQSVIDLSEKIGLK